MQHVLRAVDEPEPGPKLEAWFRNLWPAYRKWFSSEGDARRPSYADSRRALREHMPELVPTWEAMCDLAGGGDRASRFLSLYCPTPYLTGCSQAVWTRRGSESGSGSDGAGSAAATEPMLVRNYDYAPRLWEGILLHSRWNDRGVIAMADCIWGVLDGINDAGLAVSLAFGGSKRVGTGFGMPLILRYVLEFCDTVGDALAVLSRVPSHMAYNVTLLDAAGTWNTALVAPGRPTSVVRRPLATNHQHRVEWPDYVHATASLDREIYLRRRLDDPDETPEHFVGRFLAPPLYTRKHAAGFGTLYTSVYRPASRQAVFVWPGQELHQSFDRFRELEVGLTYLPEPPTDESPGTEAKVDTEAGAADLRERRP